MEYKRGNKNFVVIGVDPGLNGGFTLFKNSHIEHSQAMPKTTARVGSKRKQIIDIPALLEKFIELFEIYCQDAKVYGFIERNWARPNQKPSSNFNFGFNTGIIQSCLHMVGAHIYEVTPTKWQNDMFKCIPEETKLVVEDSKSRALIAAKKLFPKQNFLATKRSKTPHDGIVDAMLIGYYGVKQVRFH